MKKYWVCIVLFWSVSWGINAQNPSLDSLMKHVEILASDNFSGRLSGTSSYEKAADYCYTYFEIYGLKRIQHTSLTGFNQNFDIESNEIQECNLSIITQDGKKYNLKLGKDYSCRGFTGSSIGLTDVVFCGYGQNKDDYNDYRGVDVAGKAVILFKSNPPFAAPDSGWGSFSIRRQVQIAKEKGAKAVIFASRPNPTKPQMPIGSTAHGVGSHQADMPQFELDAVWVDTLLEGTRYPLERLDRLTVNLKMPFSLSAKSKVEFSVQASYNPAAKTRNLIAHIEGSDPHLKKEFIFVSAHLDHVGKQAHVVYPGANDNASGVAAVLELARLISISKKKPSRSIVFVLFSGEEKGLDGSRFMANNLPLPKEKIIAMYNMDCIAFGDSIQIGNGLSNPELWNKMKEIDSKHSRRMVEQTWSGGGADLTPFHQIGIPGLYVVSRYSYTHLHLPSDKPETLNKKTFFDVVNLVYQNLITY